jgi:hypothetical protein
MEGLPTNYREAENIAIMFDSDWMRDVSMTQGVAEQTTNLRSRPAGDVTCEALHLALSALHIGMAWHAGVMSAEVAMEDLHRAIGRAIRSSSTGAGRDAARDIL